MSTNRPVNELKIPVPWGHVAAKVWGEETLPPILVFHGRMDNAGAFDNLIPLLPNKWRYICIDHPSHGKSSHFPPHLPIYTLNYLIVYKLIMKHFQKHSYPIIGHSYGGHIGLIYARLYPETVEKLVMIDTIYTDIAPVEKYKSYLVGKIDYHMKLLEKLATGKAPSYSYEEAFKRISNARETEPLNERAANALLGRALEPVGDGKYTFTLDQRMKDYLDQMHDCRYASESLIHDPIQCPLLMILANQSEKYWKFYKPVLGVLENQENVQVRRVNGGHDIHNNEPEKIAPIISEFLLNKDLAPLQDKVKTVMNNSPKLLKWLKILK